MNKKQTDSSGGIWVTLNRILPFVALIVIGYILWAALYGNKPQDATPVASANGASSTWVNSTDAADSSDDDVQLPSAAAAEKTDVDSPIVPEQPPQASDESAADDEPLPEANSTPPAQFDPTIDKGTLGPEPNFYDKNVANFLFENKCSECHKLARVEKHEFAHMDSVQPLIEKMIENGLEVNEKEQAFLVHYLQSTFVK